MKESHAEGDWGETYHLVWDAWGRLVEIKDGSLATVAAYGYDGATRRITKTVGGTTIHCYYNERWKAIEEREGSSTDATRQYLWGARPNHRDELVRGERDTTGGGTLDERLYCLMDYYDPIAMTDAAGDVVERYEFSAFGLRRVMNAAWEPQVGSVHVVEFAFHGQFLDTETGYYDYGYRYYSPEIGRWLSKDPIEEKGGLNLYSFSHNNGLNRLDRNGTFVAEDEDTRDYCAANLVGRFNLVYYFNHPDSDPGVQKIRQDLISQLGDPGGEIWARGVWECARTSFHREAPCPDFECIWGAVVQFALGVSVGELTSATTVSIIDKYWNHFVKPIARKYAKRAIPIYGTVQTVIDSGVTFYTILTCKEK